MDEMLQPEKQDVEYKNPNEDQGGIRRRLRDRDLLRKRKAEAEEKETKQVESLRKKQRAENISGTKKRGRPSKTEPTPEISVILEEHAVPQDDSAVLVVSEPSEVILFPTSGSQSTLPAVVSQPVPDPLPVLESLQSLVFALNATAPASVKPTPAVFPTQAPVPAATKNLDPTPVFVQEFPPASSPTPDAAPVPILNQAPLLPDPSAAPFQVGAISKESVGREGLSQVTIEDFGPDEEENISLSQDKRTDEDLNGTPSINIPEQNKVFPLPSLSPLPPTQEYLPGN